MSLKMTKYRVNCNHSKFPLPNIQDNNELIKPISESLLKPIDISLDDLQKSVINPLSISDCDGNSALCDSDPI